MPEVKYFDVRLTYKPSAKKASPFVSVKIECMAARNKEDAKARALALFALAGHNMQVSEVIEL